VLCACAARDAPVARGQHVTDAPSGPCVAGEALPGGKRSRARRKARRQLGQVERVVLAGATQAQWIVIGIEVWHVREPPYRPDKKSAHRGATDFSSAF
jgi:hypothetical protein